MVSYQTWFFVYLIIFSLLSLVFEGTVNQVFRCSNLDFSEVRGLTKPCYDDCPQPLDFGHPCGLNGTHALSADIYRRVPEGNQTIPK